MANDDVWRVNDDWMDEWIIDKWMGKYDEWMMNVNGWWMNDEQMMNEQTNDKWVMSKWMVDEW